MKLSYYLRPIVIACVIWVLYLYLSTDLLIKKIPLDKSSPVCGSVRSYPIKGFSDYYFYLKIEKQTVLVLTKYKPLVSLYDYVCVEGAIDEIKSPEYFGNFSWKRYMNMRNIFWQVRGRVVEKVKDGPVIFSYISRIRYGFVEVVERSFNKDTSAIILGLVLGEKAELSKDLKDAIARCGILHLMVASGSNISYFMGIVTLTLGFLGVRRKLTFIISLLFGLVYVIMIGFDPPITRAYLMILLGFGFYSLKKNIDPLQIVFAVFLLVSIVNPLYIYDPSFVMSFLCVYGIVVGFMNWGWLVGGVRFKVYPTDSRVVLFLKNLLNSMISFAFSIFLMTVSSQIGLLPYTLSHFYRFSLISFFSNIILVPFSSVIITSSLLWLGLSNLIAVQFISVVLEYMVKFFIQLVYFFSSFKYSVLYLSPYSQANYISVVIFMLFLLHLPSIDFSKIIWRVFGFTIAFVFFISFLWRDSIKDDIVFRVGGKEMWFVERNSSYYLIDPVLDADKVVNAVYASRRGRIDYILISSYSTYRKKTVEKLNSVFNIKRIYLPLWVCEDDFKNISCVFGGDKGEGFRVDFKDRYGYFNISSSLNFCFEDRCF